MRREVGGNAFVALTLALGAAVLIGAPAAFAALPNLASRSKLVQSPEPLRTDTVWDIDPGESNPQRALFALKRDVSLDGLRAVQRKDGRFGIDADAIQTIVTLSMRGAGAPAYRELAQFPCALKESPGWFATPAGAARGAAAAAEAWDREVQSESVKLGVLLRRLDEPTASLAGETAQLLFEAWLKDTTALWRPKAARAARDAEWESERRDAVTAKVCVSRPDGSLRPGEAAKPLNAADIRWENFMEPVPPPPAEPYPLPIARAPARLWDGAFSIRALLGAAGAKKLDGQFLLDSATPETIVSPDWLRSQGILPPLVEVTGAALERALFTGGETLSSGDLSRRGRISTLSVGGLELPVHDVLLHDTELYAPPENVATCCSGVLGLEVLQRFVIQFRPGTPTEVVFWPRENFHPVWTGIKNPMWIEASVSGTGEVISACELQPASPSSGGGAKPLAGVLWDTAASVGLEAHAPWKYAAGKLWNVVCDRPGTPIAMRVAAETGSQSSPFARERMPAATIGIPLMARGEFVLDLPHGRIWFSADDLAQPVRRNETGLELAYQYLGEDRVLKTISIRGGHAAPVAPLVAAGLRVGSIITEVDGKPAEDLDLWEVEQRLAGARGTEVKLSWVAPSGTGDATSGVIAVH